MAIDFIGNINIYPYMDRVQVIAIYQCDVVSLSIMASASNPS